MLSSPRRVEKYRDEYACLSVCLSVCLSAHITRKPPDRTSSIFVHMAVTLTSSGGILQNQIFLDDKHQQVVYSSCVARRGEVRCL